MIIRGLEQNTSPLNIRLQKIKNDKFSEELKIIILLCKTKTILNVNSESFLSTKNILLKNRKDRDSN